ncbi:PLAC8 motif-containing protein - like 10, partial [Theobroma cacao]
RWKNSDEPTMGQIKTGPSVSEPHHQVQAEPEPQCHAIASLHEPTQNQASATIYQTQQSTRANETLPQQQLQQQHYQPEPNQRTYGVVQPAAPPMPAQFSPQTAQNTGPNEHPLEYPPLSRQQTIPIQPNQDVGFPVPVDGWKTGLFDCMDDPMNACGTSGLLYGLIAFFIGVPCILSCAYRTKLRNKLGLVESPAPDWVTHCFCDWCALCQEYRELQQRGWDPSIGKKQTQTIKLDQTSNNIGFKNRRTKLETTQQQKQYRLMKLLTAL